MIDRPVRYGYGHNPHAEDGIVFDDPWDPLGVWADPEEIADEWRQSAGSDMTPKADD